jgi:hypothetical protein
MQLPDEKVQLSDEMLQLSDGKKCNYLIEKKLTNKKA